MSYPHQEPTRVCNTDKAVTDAFGPSRVADEFYRDRFNSTAKVLENPILDSFEKNHVVKVSLPGFGPQKSRSVTVDVNRKLAHLFVAAFEKIKSENLPYVLHETGAYLFRYQQNPSVKAAIANRPEYETLRKQNGFWDSWNILCAEQDRKLRAFDDQIPFKNGTTLKKNLLSNHAFGSAIDINWGTNPYQKGARFDMPRRIVEIMEGFGFHWGGYYHDYMHFEYLRSTIVGIPDEVPPQVLFPFCANEKRESPLKYYFLNEGKGGGYFPLGLQQNLHGGVHLEPDASSPLVPVQAAMPGYIVATRLMAPGTGGDNATVRDVTEGRQLGFVLIRHELEEKRDSGSTEPPKVHPLYSLYMHLASPAWGADSKEFEKAPWLASFLKMRFGGVVNLEPTSADVGKTFWAREAITPEATSARVHGAEQPMALRNGTRIVALSKPSPEDVSQALQALQDGAIVTFDRALFPVAAGETIGFVTEGLPLAGASGAASPGTQTRLPKYLHWELFSFADEGAIPFLQNKAGDLGDLLKKAKKEIHEDNFLEMPSSRKPDAQNELQEMLRGTDKVVDDLQADGYGRVLQNYLKDGQTFFSGERNEATPFTYPLELTLDNAYQYKGESGGSCLVEVTYKKAGVALPHGPERIQLNPNVGKVTLNVPVVADEIALWSPHFFLDKPTTISAENLRKERLESRAALIKKAAGHRWRNLVLEHMNEWTPKGLDSQLDARGEAGHLDGLVNVSDQDAFKEFKKQLRPLSWWSRKKDENDPFGEVPVLGAEAEEKSIFGSGEGLLPEDAGIVNMHPVTALWLIDILLEKEAFTFRKSWPPATLKRSESTQKPRFLGLLWKEQEPWVGLELLAVLVQHGYGSTDGANATDVIFWGKAKESGGVGQAPLMLCRSPYTDGVAMGRLRFPFWGKWEVHATDGSEQRFEPVETGATEIELPRPELAAQTFQLGTNGVSADPSSKVRPRVTGTFVCRTNWPVALAGYMVFDHWRAPKGGQPDLGGEPTPGKLAIPVFANRPPDERVMGGLKYRRDMIVGREKEKSNPQVTTHFSFQDFVKHPKLGTVFTGDVKTVFRLAVPLVQRLQALRDACRPKDRHTKDIPLAVKRLALTGLSLLVVPASGKSADLAALQEKLPLLPASEYFSAELVEEESAIRLTYDPPPSAGPLGFEFDPGPALGLIAAEALSAEGETLHVRPRFIAPNGGHTLLAGKESPLGDATKLIAASAEDIKAACGNDFLEVVADKLLPPVARFEFGDIEIKMGRGKVHTEVRLHGDARQWGAARPVFKLEGAEPVRQGTIVGQVLSADWDLIKDSKGKPITGRWGASLEFSTELSLPDKVATPPPPVSREVEIRPSLGEISREIGPKEIRFVGKASTMPTDIPLCIICERVDAESGQWIEETRLSEAIRYKIPTKGDSHFGYCTDTGAFEAALPRIALKKASGPGPYRFTWLPKGERAGASVAVHGIPVEGRSIPEVRPEDLSP